MLYELLCGNVTELLSKIRTVQCVVTSPPYFQKKKYSNAADAAESKDVEKELGQEKTREDFINNLVKVFVAIPLEKWGSIWVNLGDTRDRKTGGLQMVPELFAAAMQQKGFVLADSVIWAKVQVDEDGCTEGGCMPEPANNRLNSNGYEMLYRFVNGNVSDAWTDTCAVKIPRVKETDPTCIPYLPASLMRTQTCVEGRNLHNVWRIQMGQTKKKHYAVYPVTLCERPIAMTCPMWVCPACLQPRVREVVMEEYDENRGSKRIFGKYNTEANADTSGRMDTGREYIPRKPVTKGWTDCGCGEGYNPGIVLDPFCGTGTTGEVALKMGRRFIGIDLYKKFIDMTQERCQETVDWLNSQGLNPSKEAR